MEHPVGSEARPLRVAVIGSGPSGFYAVGALFKSDHHVTVDVFDRLPTPFGLVRGGVAPDHQKIKNVIRVYNKTAANERFRFFGNVTIGTDISVEELGLHYDQIVFATGNETDRIMGIPGEDLDGVHSATEFVGWFNGHPDFQHCSFRLSEAKRVAVVGNGNVAMDVTRILAHQPDDLAATDITDEAIEALRGSAVEEVVLLGRRGPAQAAFSPKEIKEVGALPAADLIVPQKDAAIDPLSRSWLEEKAAPSARKNVEYLASQVEMASGDAPRRVVCRFLVSPVEFLGKDGKLAAIRIEHNELYADDSGTPRPRGTGETEELAVDLVFKAVGYRGVPLPGVPFDERWGVFPNQEGRLLDPESGSAIPNQYVVGWAKRGPSGLIGTNGPDSEATVQKMLEDVEGRLAAQSDNSTAAIVKLLESKGIDFVSFADWNLIDSEETKRGEAKGKIRDKFATVDAMMAALHQLREW